MMAEEIVPQGRFGCPFCTERFKTLGDKKRHLRTEHKPKEES